MKNIPPHKFHIPVMGLAFTIDTPIKVARFGISSCISIVEDRLIELMRKQYYPLIHQPYFPIVTSEPDYRAKRITDYLNLVNTIVKAQLEELKKGLFEKGAEIVRYFEMLPDDSMIKQLYNVMMNMADRVEKDELADYLRTQISAGSIDVNILTKTDRNTYTKQGKIIEDCSDAVSALRGYANSDLQNSSIVFSAGLNPRLYNYLEKCTAFEINEQGEFNKRIIIKVSDFRSAFIQGKYLAKKGIWVSEFRIESGLNCGGHAFATEGYLLGPILQEFKNKRQELTDSLFELYSAALLKKEIAVPAIPPKLRFSVQGGIGTAEEDTFLHTYYGMDSTGWGTPFLLVPEATTVDEATLKLLVKARKKDVVLSNNSPLGVRFYYLKGSSGEAEKLKRIQDGRPGSPCTEKHLAFNTEFTEMPICTASRQYQKLKIAQLQSLTMSEEMYKKQLAGVLEKECLCIGLSNAAAITYEQPLVKKLDAVNICPGPNIAYFSKLVSLQTMTDHIYGRTNIMEDSNRPNMFVAELILYLNYLQEQLENVSPAGTIDKKEKYFSTFFHNLREGITYYKNLKEAAGTNFTRYLLALNLAESRLEMLIRPFLNAYSVKIMPVPDV